MMSVLSYFWLCALLAFLIGLLTAWWAWARYRASQEVHDGLRDLDQSRTSQALLRDAPPAPVLTPEPTPVREPESAPVPLATASVATAAAVTGAAAAKAKAAPKTKKPAKPKADPKDVAKPKAAAKAKPKPKAAPKPKAHPVAAGLAIAGAVGDPDNLELIKGVGPKLNTLLTSLGVLRFDQIAAWKKKDIEAVDDHLGNFKGRIDRDNWVDQAGYLAKGDVKGFEAKYGSLGSEIK